MFNKGYKKRVLCIGIPDMAYICLDGLNAAGVNIVGVVGPKKNHATYADFKRFVESQKLNFIEYDKLSDAGFISRIKALNADIAIVCSFNNKIPKVLLESVKDGFVNVHPSLLPHYRGPNPYSHVIMNDEKVTGVTLHFMDEEFDTGDIIIQQKLPITPRETMGTLFNRLNLMGLQLLLKILSNYEKSDLHVEKQTQGEFPIACNLTDDMLFINYKNSAENIERFIRAVNPFIIASTMFRNTIVKVFSAQVIKTQSTIDYPVGTIVKVENDKFYIATSDGLLAPTVLQFGSFFVGDAKDFTQILNIKIGEKFGG